MNAYRDPARLLRVMAHPVRLEILEIIRRSDECVCHLSAALKRPQPYVSQQLAILRNAGLIADRKDGNLVFYGLANGPAAGQVTEILGAIADEADVGQIGNLPAEGHKSVAGCNCPKCEQGGACGPKDSTVGLEASAGRLPSRIQPPEGSSRGKVSLYEKAR
jgi:DNA-binding transcriptional ArsR family regulator